MLRWLFLLPAAWAEAPLPGCDVYGLNRCQGDVIETDKSFEANRWFTPRRGEAGYQASFQDYGSLVGHAHVEYAPGRGSAKLEVRALHRDPSVKLTYVFGGASQSSSTLEVKAGAAPTTVQVRGSDGTVLDLDAVQWLWNVPPLPPSTGAGERGAVVELFGWPHADVALECPHIAKMGYMGVKLFPMQEQLMSGEPFNNMLNPWYFMYQPVSYRLDGRMGSREELLALIKTCRQHGVRVYADAVINHMTGGGNDANTQHRNPQAGCSKWGNKTSSLRGGHSPFYTQNFAYTTGSHTGKPPLQEFPAVPYGPQDFHCERVLNSWSDPLVLNAGWLTGLTDLNTERDNVRERIADYLTDLLSHGFSGFRVDAAKHIRPEDIAAIFGKLRRNLGQELPGDFQSWLEVLLGGEADLLMCNGKSGYNYGAQLVQLLKDQGLTAAEVERVKTWNCGYPKEPAKGVDNCDPASSGLVRQAIQNDDADQQNPGSSSRDMQSQGCVLTKGCAEADHRRFEVELFSNPPGASNNEKDYPLRLVLSSFYWGEGEVQGIPDGLSDCSRCEVNCKGCKGMPYVKAYRADSTGYDKGAGQYTRVHRDVEIVNAMRKWMGLPPTTADAYARSLEVIV